MTTQHGLEVLLKKLRLPSIIESHAEVAITAQNNGWSFGQYLHRLAELEIDDRHRRRIKRLQRQSGLPSQKTTSTFELKKVSTKIQRVLPTLCEGGFVERSENLLVFGNPGTGKSHLVCAIGNELGCRCSLCHCSTAF